MLGGGEEWRQLHTRRILKASVLRDNIYLISNIFSQDGFLPHTSLRGARDAAGSPPPALEEKRFSKLRWSASGGVQSCPPPLCVRGEPPGTCLVSTLGPQRSAAVRGFQKQLERSFWPPMPFRPPPVDLGWTVHATEETLREFSSFRCWFPLSSGRSPWCGASISWGSPRCREPMRRGCRQRAPSQVTRERGRLSLRVQHPPRSGHDCTRDPEPSKNACRAPLGL